MGKLLVEEFWGRRGGTRRGSGRRRTGQDKNPTVATRAGDALGGQPTCKISARARACKRKEG